LCRCRGHALGVTGGAQQAARLHRVEHRRLRLTERRRDRQHRRRVERFVEGVRQFDPVDPEVDRLANHRVGKRPARDVEMPGDDSRSGLQDRGARVVVVGTVHRRLEVAPRQAAGVRRGAAEDLVDACARADDLADQHALVIRLAPEAGVRLELDLVVRPEPGDPVGAKAPRVRAAHCCAQGSAAVACER